MGNAAHDDRYSVFPLLLASTAAASADPAPDGRGVALAWYRTMLAAPRGQGPFGSSAAVATNGRNVCPLLTWDSKTTTVLAALGGVAALTREQLRLWPANIAAGGKEEGEEEATALDRFVSIVDSEWGSLFPEAAGRVNKLPGHEMAFAAPTASIPAASHAQFTACST